MSILPDANVVGKTKLNRTIIESDDWGAAKKNFDMSAADRVVGELWSDKKSSLLKSYFKKPPNVVFITVPSTSGTNAVPISLAKRLSVDFNTSFCIGENYFLAIHGQESKYISRLQRPFNRREYVADNIEALKKECTGKRVVIVDDLLTTGGSVASFCMILNDNGIEAKSVAALMGDKRLEMDLKTQERLAAALVTARLSFDSNAIGARLTRVEAGGLIMQINLARSENEKQKIAGNLHGLLNQRPFRNMGRDPASGRYESPQRKNDSDAQVFERVQTWPVQLEGRPINKSIEYMLDHLDRQIVVYDELKKRKVEGARDRLMRNRALDKITDEVGQGIDQARKAVKKSKAAPQDKKDALAALRQYEKTTKRGFGLDR